MSKARAKAASKNVREKAKAELLEQMSEDRRCTFTWKKTGETHRCDREKTRKGLCAGHLKQQQRQQRLKPLKPQRNFGGKGGKGLYIRISQEAYKVLKEQAKTKLAEGTQTSEYQEASAIVERALIPAPLAA
jgi:hypothetical protein